MAKMGRPKAEEPKSKKVATRVSEAEYNRLKEYAEQHSLTISQVINLSLESYISSNK